MNEYKKISKAIAATLLFGAAIFSTSSASAQNTSSDSTKVNVESGDCEDNTCAHRVLSIASPSSSSSSTTGGSGTSCTPSSYQNAATSCPTGYTGTMYSTTYVTCPNGPTGAPATAIGGTNTSGCTPIPPPTVTCTPSAIKDPAESCPPGYSGYQYTTTTTTCPGGSYGVPKTTTSAYDTSSCVKDAAPVTCTPSSTTNSPVACGPDFTGTMYSTTSISCPNGSYGAPVTTTSVNTSGCTPIAPATVTCTASTTKNPAVACGSNQTGTKYTTTTVSCPTGSYGVPLTSTSAYNTSGCTDKTVTCEPSTTTNPAVPCGINQDGTKYTTTTITCPNGAYGLPKSTTSAYNTTSCSAAAATCWPDSWDNPPVACGEGYTGNKYTTTTRTCPSGQYGAPAYSVSGFNMSGCSFATVTPPPTTPKYGCSWSLDEWASGSNVYCHQGYDTLVNGSALDRKCGNVTVLEVTRIDVNTGASRAGYVCSSGSTSLYNINGTRI